MRPIVSVALCALFIADVEAKKPLKTPAAAKVETGIDESAIDPSVEPCDDFYKHACGGWLKKTEIPGDRSSWYRSFSEIDERNEHTLKAILEELSSGSEKIGVMYAACMDEEKIEKTADAEIAAELKKIDADVKDVPSLAKKVAELHLGIGNPMFRVGSQQDFKDANLMIGVVDQGGLGLPDRDYYLKNDPKMKEKRDKYVEHVKAMFVLAGTPDADAAKNAAAIMKLETKLAQASMSRVDRRDPKKIYHRLELAGLEKQAPKFPWKAYFKDLGHPAISQINVAVPEFFTAVSTELDKTSLADWKVYLKWNLLHGAAQSLGKKFVDENFAFYGKTLQGTDKILPRWKRCVQAVDRSMGEALAQPFVKKTFGAEGKAATVEMVKGIEAAMEKNLTALAWMDDTTRTQAFAKLHAIANKIGYPDKWRDYGKLEVTRDSHLQNMIRAAVFESHRDLDKVGKPVDRSEWFMTPPSVNAYYEPSLNEMVFPAGILQPPFYSRAANASVNYGAIGMVMGHELTHGFDDEGRQFDAKGNLADWWSPKVNAEFEKRAQCVAEQYDGYTVLNGEMHVNGKLTLGENIADLGGIKLAYAAWRASKPAKEQAPLKVGKYTDEQLFFLGVGQAWCGKVRDEARRMRITTDPHSPAEYRVNGPLSNLSEFAAAFQCKPGTKMVREKQCVVW